MLLNELPNILSIYTCNVHEKKGMFPYISCFLPLSIYILTLNSQYFKNYLQLYICILSTFNSVMPLLQLRNSWLMSFMKCDNSLTTKLMFLSPHQRREGILCCVGLSLRPSVSRPNGYLEHY